MADNRSPNLPKREPGTHLPSAAYRPVGIARVPKQRWASDEASVRLLLNALRRWDLDASGSNARE